MSPVEQPNWRILMIDDDNEDFYLTKKFLSQAKSRKISLDWAPTYEFGKASLQSDHYDAVLVDYDLGSKTGIELIRETSPDYPAPIILYTGRGGYEIDLEAQKAGATLYLTKAEATPLLLERSVRYAIERKQFEAQLLAAQKAAVSGRNQLQAVLDSLPIGVAIIDAQGGNPRANAGFEKVWGGPRPVARSIKDYAAYRAWWVDSGRQVEPEEWASARAVFNGETVVGQLLQIERFDGSRTYVLNSAAPVFDGQGKVVGSAVAIMDISQLIEAEQALQLSKDNYRLLFSSIQEGFALHEIVYDQAGKPIDYRFLEINPAFEELIGLKATDVLGKTVLEILPETVPYWIETYGEVVQTGKSVRFEQYSQAQSKSYEVVAFRPQPNQFAVIFTDITERRQAGQNFRSDQEGQDQIM